MVFCWKGSSIVDVPRITHSVVDDELCEDNENSGEDANYSQKAQRWSNEFDLFIPFSTDQS